MSTVKYRVAIIGCGRMGQQYAQAYTTYPDTEIVAIADATPNGVRSSVNALGLMRQNGN